LPHAPAPQRRKAEHTSKKCVKIPFASASQKNFQPRQFNHSPKGNDTMITEVTDLGDGIEGYRTFTLAFSPGAKLVHKLAAGPLTSTKPASHTPIPVQNGQPFHAATPIGDHLGDDNKPAYASLNAIQNAARVGDYGFCLDAVASGALKPDIKLRGVAAWKTGPSANEAANKLAQLWAKHQATLQDNRKIQTGHRL